MWDEAEHLVAHAVAADPVADLLDDPGEVAAEDDGELVLEHLRQGTHPDEDVDGVDRGGVHAHDDLVGSRARLREVSPQGGLALEAVEGEGSHDRPFAGTQDTFG